MLLCTILSTSADASLLNARVSHIVPAQFANEDTLILLDSGRVLRTNDKTLILGIEKSAINHRLGFIESNGQVATFVDLDLYKNDPVLNPYYDSSLPKLSPKTLPTDIRYTDNSFIPTNLQSLDDAQALMDQLKYNRKSIAECYQRAHFWSAEMLQMANIQSGKMFVFFSVKYMREYRFNWWFHVAPFVLVNNEEQVLDSWFLDHPVDVQTWTNLFLDPHPICKVVSNYKDYENHQQDEYCFLRKLPMYYFEPTEVENRDANNVVVNTWLEDQVASAYNSLRTAPWILR